MAEIKCQHTSLPSEDFLALQASSGFLHALTCGQGISSHPHFSLMFPSSYHLLLFLFKKFFFIYLFLAVLGLCCCVGYFLVAICRLLIAAASRCRAGTLGPMWSSIVAPLDSRGQAQWLWCMGLVAPWHVGPSWITDQTSVFCTGRQTLYH